MPDVIPDDILTPDDLDGIVRIWKRGWYAGWKAAQDQRVPVLVDPETKENLVIAAKGLKPGQLIPTPKKISWGPATISDAKGVRIEEVRSPKDLPLTDSQKGAIEIDRQFIEGENHD